MRARELFSQDTVAIGFINWVALILFVVLFKLSSLFPVLQSFSLVNGAAGILLAYVFYVSEIVAITMLVKTLYYRFSGRAMRFVPLAFTINISYLTVYIVAIYFIFTRLGSR